MGKRSVMMAALLGLGAVQGVQAQSAQDFEEMRAEIRRLRAEVEALKKDKGAMQEKHAGMHGAGHGAMKDKVDDLELRAKDAVVLGDIPNSFRLPNSETSLRIYGFAELNMVKEFKGDNGDSDYASFVPYVPLSGSAEANRNGRTYLHARTTRLGVEASTPSPYGPIGLKLEGDFNNDPRTGNAAVSGDIKNIYTQQATNSYNFRLRHAYGQFGGLLIGQTWSTFMDVDNGPETVDFNGPIGATFIRQPMIRYSYNTKDSGVFTAALENAVSYVLDNTGSVTTKGFSRAPDLVARWDKSFAWGSLSLRGVTHELRVKDGATGVGTSSWGYGLAASGLIKAAGDDIVLWGLTWGQGIGRYFNYIEGAFYDAANNRILKEKALGVQLAYQHKAAPNLRFNAVFGAQKHYDNAYTDFARANGLDAGRFGINRSVWQTHLGFIWNPVKNVDFGAEWLYGKRKTLAGETGEMNRLDFSAKYYFN
ncbi:DcaP family trimeric outer membrane transporter [Massilia sp. W12]|uniref:DcaP family trimeric outer membrane transporter n=1 Tax=Massilia sp. W12 TaxID=3126507 RepID=UPI0030D5280B